MLTRSYPMQNMEKLVSEELVRIVCVFLGFLLLLLLLLLFFWVLLMDFLLDCCICCNGL